MRVRSYGQKYPLYASCKERRGLQVDLVTVFSGLWLECFGCAFLFTFVYLCCNSSSFLTIGLLSSGTRTFVAPCHSFQACQRLLLYGMRPSQTFTGDFFCRIPQSASPGAVLVLFSGYHCCRWNDTYTPPTGRCVFSLLLQAKLGLLLP